jgi:hypothetical protein
MGSGYGLSILRFNNLPYVVLPTDSFPITDIIEIKYKFNNMLVGKIQLKVTIQDNSEK